MKQAIYLFLLGLLCTSFTVQGQDEKLAENERMEIVIGDTIKFLEPFFDGKYAHAYLAEGSGDQASSNDMKQLPASYNGTQAVIEKLEDKQLRVYGLAYVPGQDSIVRIDLERAVRRDEVSVTSP